MTKLTHMAGQLTSPDLSDLKERKLHHAVVGAQLHAQMVSLQDGIQNEVDRRLAQMLLLEAANQIKLIKADYKSAKGAAHAVHLFIRAQEVDLLKSPEEDDEMLREIIEQDELLLQKAGREAKEEGERLLRAKAEEDRTALVTAFREAGLDEKADEMAAEPVYVPEVTVPERETPGITFVNKRRAVCIDITKVPDMFILREFDQKQADAWLKSNPDMPGIPGCEIQHLAKPRVTG